MVPPSKVILGVPFFGIDWPTTDGTLNATATGAASDVSLGDIDASGHPQYWDPVTDSGWTSYQVGNQWHETFFEDPTSLYDTAQLAQANGLAGVGIWTLGMDGNAPADLAALLGFAPAVKDGPAGPAVDVRLASGGHVAEPAHAVPDELVGSDRPDLDLGPAVEHDDHDHAAVEHDHDDNDVEHDDDAAPDLQRAVEGVDGHPHQGDRHAAGGERVEPGGTADRLRDPGPHGQLFDARAGLERLGGERDHRPVPRCGRPPG